MPPIDCRRYPHIKACQPLSRKEKAIFAVLYVFCIAFAIGVYLL